MTAMPRRARPLGWLSAVLIAGFIAVSGLNFLASTASIRETISRQTLPLTADNVYSEIQKDLLRPVFISSLMAHDTFVRDWILGGEIDIDQITRYLNEVKTKYDVVIAALVIDRSRRYYYQGGLLRTIGGPENPMDTWFYRVRDMAEPYETNFDPDELDQNSMTVYVNYRVLDYHGRFIGSTGVGLKLTTVSRLIDRYQAQFRRRIFFVDRTGKVVLTGRGMSKIAGSIRALAGISGIADRILAGGNETVPLEYARDGALVLVNSRFIPELGWHLVVEQDDADEIDAARRMLVINLSIGIAVSILVLVVMRLAIRRYQRRIETLAAEAVGQAEREKHLAAEQQRFVAMVSHEFRTPLAIIDTALQSIRNKQSEVSGEVASRLHLVQRAGLRLQDLVENYLTKDRLDGSPRLRAAEPVDLFAVAKRIIRRAESDDIAAEFDSAPAPVRGDADLLRIAISNLISNAIKYSPADATIRVTGTVTGNAAEISVADRGAGIAETDLPHIFDLYYRGTGTRVGGSGLGLFLVKRIIEEHGGSVSAESQLGVGTTLRIRLPISDPSLRSRDGTPSP